MQIDFTLISTPSYTDCGLNAKTSDAFVMGVNENHYYGMGICWNASGFII